MFFAGDLHVRGTLLPSAHVSPYATLGVGLINVPGSPAGLDNFLYGFTGAGVEFPFKQNVSSFLEASTTYPFREGLDGLRGGNVIHDNLLSVRAGLIYSIR